MRLAGKVVVITGAGSGTGRAMAELFSSEGAKIAAAEWNETTLAEVVEAVKTAGGEIVGVAGDVSKDEDCRRIAEEAKNAFGRIDVLCNNAGVMDVNQGVAELDDAMWRRVLGINLDGPMFLSRAIVPIMLAGGGGSIINTASVAGVGGGAAGAAYTASKHGVIGLTRAIAFRYGQEGVRCNAIV
ncbi:SDR family NAD(P)-dependent oxidoreductase, partial [bacterium]|nr:SDR family NAD(P)-dependent oxidoreductase [bacterium]